MTVPQTEKARSRPRPCGPLYLSNIPRRVGMQFLDTLSLIFSFFIALLLCCMLLALTRLGASLKLFYPKQPSPSYLLHPPPTHLPRTRLSTARRNRPSTSPRSHYGYLSTQPYSTMLKQAVNSHNAAIPHPAPTIAAKQQSLGSSFARTGSAHNISNPLASDTRQNGAGEPGLSRSLARGSHNQGIKRTSNGLAKALDFQDDIVDYPTLEIAGMEKENDVPMAYSASARNNSTGLATALFDEDDFDSDVDLDIEDPATKGTVTYPRLPQVGSSESRDSGYQSRPQTAHQRLELDSSQPIPWSSSPLDHFKTPKKAEPPKPKSKRGFLPWSQTQKAASTQEAEDRIDSEEEVAPPKKKHTTEAKAQVTATPKPKSQYLWNATASALKEQQKNLREQNKKLVKDANTSVDDLKEAVKKRKKNTVHRIFLSEEQQNVLNLVTEYKKSVFFTGSAGISSTHSTTWHG